MQPIEVFSAVRPHANEARFPEPPVQEFLQVCLELARVHVQGVDGEWNGSERLSKFFMFLIPIGEIYFLERENERVAMDRSFWLVAPEYVCLFVVS